MFCDCDHKAPRLRRDLRFYLSERKRRSKKAAQEAFKKSTTSSEADARGGDLGPLRRRRSLNRTATYPYLAPSPFPQP
jgi:hypothetical protein